MKTAKEWADKYLKGRDHITDLIKEVQQDIIHETVNRCAKNAQVQELLWNRKSRKGMNFNTGDGYSYKVDKDSILKVEQEIIKELEL